MLTTGSGIRPPTSVYRGILPALAMTVVLAGCSDAPDGQAVVSATIVDSAGRPLPGAFARLELVEDSTVVEGSADSAGRVVLALDASGAGSAWFAEESDAEPGRGVRAPLLVAPGEVELRVHLGGETQGVEYPDDGPRMARWGRAVSLATAIKARWRTANREWLQGDQQGDFESGIQPLIDSVGVLLRQERDSEVRSALWVARLWPVYMAVPVPPDTADLILREVDPGAAVWAWDASDAAGLINRAFLALQEADPSTSDDAAMAGLGPDGGSDRSDATGAGLSRRAMPAASPYIDEVVASHSAPGVRAALLFSALRSATTNGRKELATRYYQRLVSELPDTREAELAARYAPDDRLWVGSRVPDVALPALDASAPPIKPADLAGPATLVDFWAIWCTPCIAELPNLRVLHERFSDRGFRIVSVSFDESREAVREFLQRQPMPWEHAFADEGWGMRGPVAVGYSANALPHPVLIGPDTTILALGGALRGDALEETLERLLTPGDGGH